MPVTARLSLKFYERFGEDIANELVDWWAISMILQGIADLACGSV
jgi:hypothetical protein